MKKLLQQKVLASCTVECGTERTIGLSAVEDRECEFLQIRRIHEFLRILKMLMNF